MADGDIIERFRNSHTLSADLHAKAKTFFAGDGATHAGRVLNPYRPYITKAARSKKWDVDGNRYIDYVMGHGALILGHAHPAIVAAVQEQAARGTHYGENHELEVRWAELIKSMIPSADMVEFFPCGNEANMMSLRLCRHFTGRKKILKFTGHFHGWNDHLSSPGSAGIIPEDNEINTVNIPANNLDLLERELSTRQYAALFTEGGGASMGGAYPLDPDFTRSIQNITSTYGTVWVMDEVVTGFRDYLSGDKQGWQSFVGVQPDLTTLGKCIGGGLGAGAIVGKAEIMAGLDAKKGGIRHSGTWNANPLTAAAGVAACRLYKSGEPQKKAAEQAALLRQQGNLLLGELGIDARLYSRSVVHLYIGPVEFEPEDDTLPPTKNYEHMGNPALQSTRELLCLHLLQRGIATMGARVFVLSCVHTDEDISETTFALIESVKSMIQTNTFVTA